MAVHPADCDFPLTGLNWLQYYNKHNVYHCGVDYNTGSGNSDLGAQVVSILNGVVEYVAPLGQSNGGFGNFIIVEYPQYGVWARYAHLEDVLVRKGDKVKEGQKIGTVGATGTRYAHLHFEIFGMKLYSMIAETWKGPFRFYPSGKTKDWVVEHYYSPWEFIDRVNKEEGQEISSLDWCKKHLREVDNKGWDEINSIHNGLPVAFHAFAKRTKSWFT